MSTEGGARSCYYRAMGQYCFLNGEFVPLSQANVSVEDIGLLRGFGIYEGLITHNRKPFMLAAHLERLRASAGKLSLSVPFSDEEIRDAVRELVERNVPEQHEALVRIILTGGKTIGVIEYDPKTPTFYMLATVFEPLAPDIVENGCSVMLAEYRRELAEVKSINYIKAVLLQKARKEKHALEVVYAIDGRVYEAAGSNVFIVKNGTLITPKEGIVLGITRKVVLDLARDEFPTEERAVSTDELFDADEVFISGSFKEVVPVVAIDEKKVGAGVPGRVTRRIIERFREFTRTY